MNIRITTKSNIKMKNIKKILLGLTTTSRSDWRQKIEEIKKFKIKEVALFPTFLEKKERFELYSLLEKTDLKNIPHVHLREEDMGEDELEFFILKYNTKVFNIHASKSTIAYLKKNKYSDKIYIENLREIDNIFLKCLNNSAGLCPDFSHWEDFGVISKLKDYRQFSELVEKYKIGCCHISAVQDHFKMYEYYANKKIMKFYSNHYLEKLSELDYMKKYIKYLPNLISIELENSFTEQIRIKKYLEKIILNK